MYNWVKGLLTSSEQIFRTLVICGLLFLGWQVLNHIPTEIKDLSNKIDNNYKDLSNKIDNNYKDLSNKIDNNYKYLSNKIDNNHNELKNLLIEYLGKK